MASNGYRGMRTEQANVKNKIVFLLFCLMQPILEISYKLIIGIICYDFRQEFGSLFLC